MARITCYDGVGCIGGNKILLEDGKTKLWLDFGMNFGRWGKFYEEYLKPKTPTGLYEPIQMGLLPPFRDLYRPDLVSSLADPWVGKDEQNVGDVAGILLSHAHLDHVGALHYVREDIPVYCSAMTLAIAKAAEDTGSGAPDHYCYVASYEAGETGELKSAYYAKSPSRSRPFVLANEKPGADLMAFWNSTPSSLLPKGRPHQPAPIGASSMCGETKVRHFSVDHSLYGACAWAIETSAGSVVYTGDLRCHGRQAELTWKFAEEVGKLKPRALIIEGTRIESDDTCTEDEVRERALEEVKKAKGVVVADFGPRNVERLFSFLEIARETGRKLILLPKDAYLLEKMALAAPPGEVPLLDDKNILIYCKYEVSSLNWRKMIREKYSAKLVQPWQVATNQDKAICCFSFWDVNELAYIKPVAGSVWIYSSCERFNEEMQIDLERLRAWTDKHEMVYLGGDEKDRNNPFHVSGHACRSDLLKLIEIISPQVVIPIHTEKPELFEEVVKRELKGKCRVQRPNPEDPIEL